MTDLPAPHHVQWLLVHDRIDRLFTEAGPQVPAAPGEGPPGAGAAWPRGVGRLRRALGTRLIGWGALVAGVSIRTNPSEGCRDAT